MRFLNFFVKFAYQSYPFVIYTGFCGRVKASVLLYMGK
uniref:Uncharacterized protein n=1 Tax=Arundo donax TaxID=35708 RepID=A0A0A9EGT5_ARUDO